MNKRTRGKESPAAEASSQKEKSGSTSLLRAYYTLAKPGIIRGNLIFATAGFLLASQRDVDLVLLAALLAGMSFLIGSACVFNNYIDRGIDRKMSRTKNRALASGRIPVTHALAYGTVLGLIGSAVLIYGTNLLTFYVGIGGFFAYVVLYGIGKRTTVHGTLIGSISGATPPVAGYTAVTGNIDMAAVLLFLILVAWQMPHFYAIAIYRHKDYEAAGLPVLPVVRGMEAAKRQIVAYIAVFVIAAAALAWFGYAGYVYLAIAVAAGIVWFWRGLQGFETKDDITWAKKMFFFSLTVTMAWTLAIGLDALLF